MDKELVSKIYDEVIKRRDRKRELTRITDFQGILRELAKEYKISYEELFEAILVETHERLRKKKEARRFMKEEKE